MDFPFKKGLQRARSLSVLKMGFDTQTTDAGNSFQEYNQLHKARVTVKSGY